MNAASLDYVLPRDDEHATRLYFSRHPAKRRAGELTPVEAAIVIGVSKATINRMVKRGELQAYKLKPTRLKRTELEAWLFAHPRHLARL